MRGIITISTLVVLIFLGCDLGTSKNDHSEKLIRGKEIAAATFQSLSSELKQAMSNGGVTHAINYCNTRALPITDSLSQLYNVKIKRTSDKWRNPANQPNQAEQTMIATYRNQKKDGATLQPTVKSRDNQLVFYAPIMTQGLCLSCHGKKANMPEYATIKSLYPKDLATGYESGQLRGIWSITFLKND